MWTMGDGKQRRRVEDRQVAADTECQPAVCRNIMDRCPRQCSNRVDELTGMWAVNDLRKKQDLRFHRRHLEAPEEGVEFHVMRALGQQRGDRAELSGVPASGYYGEGAVATSPTRSQEADAFVRR